MNTGAGSIGADPERAQGGARLEAFWSHSAEDVLAALGSRQEGLGASEAAARLARDGPNVLVERRRSDAPSMLLRQFGNPIVLLLAAAAVLSFFLRDPTDGTIILAIVFVSGLLGFWQERGAALAVEKLLATVEVKSRVLRDGKEVEVPLRNLVPGDVVLLSAGSSVPADGLVLEEKDLFVNEAALTGESFPVDKSPGVVSPDAPLAKRENALFVGTHVVSGSGRQLVVRTGRNTEFGTIAERLQHRPEQTEFERGVRRFGFLLMEITLFLVIAIFAFNVFLGRPVLDSFLFALALAVGLTPQLLPAIISVNLASGARRMADRNVIVKRLASIENFGSMDVLCSDKTGTLTEGVVRVHSAVDASGKDSPEVLLHAYLNASYESSFGNPIDDALRALKPAPLDGWSKLDEVPYDFGRKRLSVLASHHGQTVLVTKGALTSVLDVCASAAKEGGRAPIDDVRPAVERLHAEFSAKGFRTLGVAIRDEVTSPIDRGSEAAMVFLGMVVLEDPPKRGIEATVAALDSLGAKLKIITGDNALVAKHLSTQIGVAEPKVLTGTDLHLLSDDALPVAVQRADLFAEIEPNQKERIVRALRKAGHVVGYMGDGINDGPALRAADVSISVQGGVDVAKDAADIVLLETDLAVLEEGVREGRRTFANTLKYVFMATSANFGNMFSMAGASLLLPFLPLLPRQILLTNLLTDLPELTLPSDRVDADWIRRPRRWEIGFIRRFMLVFGLVSSLFDYLTFGVLVWVLHAGAAEFRTGWFVESVVSATLVVLVVRTRGSAVVSRPSRPLAVACFATAVATVALPYTSLGALFGLVPLPPMFLGLMALLVAGYLASAEFAKVWFYRAAGR